MKLRDFRDDRRGVVRVIEAFLASLLLMSCLALIPAPSAVSNSAGSLTSTAQNTLLCLDSNGHLTSLIDTQNWIALKTCVAASLPLTTWFNLTVFDKNMDPLTPYPLSNAGTVSDKISSFDYVCASQNSTFTYYVVRLQLSEVGAS